MPERVVIVRCGAGDGATLRELRLRMLTEAPDAYAVERQSVEEWATTQWDRWAAEAAEARSRFVAFGYAKGAAVAMIAADLHGQDVHAGALWVDPSRRGAGVSAALLDAAETWAHDRRAARMVLTVTAANNGMVAYYERRRYTRTGRMVLGSNGREETELAKRVGR